jgi:uncharacterized membrane protein
MSTSRSKSFVTEVSSSAWFNSRVYWAGVMAVLFLAAVLRVRAYESVGYWLDELYALRISGAGSVFEILRAIPETDDNPPLYYLLLAAWREIAGSSEALTRGLTLFLSWLAVVSLTISRRALGAPVALASGLFLAILPGALFAVEARPYGFMVFFSALLVVAWFRLVRGQNQITRGVLITWGVVAALLSLTHFYGALLVLTLAITAVLELLRTGKRILARRIVVITGIALLPLAGWVFYARSTLLDRSGGTHWLQSPPRSMILDFFGWVTGGTYLSAVLIGAVVVTALILVARWHELGEAKWPLLWLTMSIFVVLVVAQLVSLWTPIWLDKYGIVLVPPIAVTLAYLIWLVTQPNMRWFIGTTAVVGAVLLTSALNDRTVIPVEPWRELAKEAAVTLQGANTLFATTAREAALFQEYVRIRAGASLRAPVTVRIFDFDSAIPAGATLFYSPYGSLRDSDKERLNEIGCVSNSSPINSKFGLVICRS